MKTKAMETYQENATLPVNVAGTLKAMGHVGPPGVWHMDDCWASMRTNERQPCLGQCSDARAAMTNAGVLP